MTGKTETRKNIYGDYITYFSGDHIGNRIEKDGIYEKREIRLFVELLKNMESPVVLDIGANIGNHTLVFSRYADTVYSFEPIPEIFSVLSRNIAQNGIENVHAFNKALSDSCGRQVIYINREGNLGASSLHRKTGDTEEAVIDSVRGDDFLSESGIERVDLIKMDVEGHEFNVLAGLEHAISRCRPLVIMEGNDEETVRRISQGCFLEKWFPGYEAFSVGHNHDREYWRGRTIWRLRRRLARWFVPVSSRLYRFDPKRVSRIILLVPPERRHCVPPEVIRPDQR